MNRRHTSLLSMAVFALVLVFLPLSALADNNTAEPTLGDEIKADARAVGDFFDDSNITTSLKAKFLAEKGLDSLDISVETVDGVVVLSGQVNNQAQVSLAGKIAEGTHGVKKVVNNLTVRQ